MRGRVLLSYSTYFKWKHLTFYFFVQGDDLPNNAFGASEHESPHFNQGPHQNVRKGPTNPNNFDPREGLSVVIFPTSTIDYLCIS